MDLLVIQLKAAIRRVLDTKGVRARVLDKVNRYGEVVIGVILERPAPTPRAFGVSGGEGEDAGGRAGPRTEGNEASDADDANDARPVERRGR